VVSIPFRRRGIDTALRVCARRLVLVGGNQCSEVWRAKLLYVDKRLERTVSSTSRRQFIITAVTATAALWSHPAEALTVACRRRSVLGPHPAPRAGITAKKVLTRDQLADTPDAIPAFDAVRAIPGIVDGIRCSCGCADQAGFYSLLSCFENEDAMARSCGFCQAEGSFVARLHGQGKALDQIRVAVDAKFGRRH
jgi:hypothetical protein